MTMADKKKPCLKPRKKESEYKYIPEKDPLKKQSFPFRIIDKKTGADVTPRPIEIEGLELIPEDVMADVTVNDLLRAVDKFRVAQAAREGSGKPGAGGMTRSSIFAPSGGLSRMSQTGSAGPWGGRSKSSIAVSAARNRSSMGLGASSSHHFSRMSTDSGPWPSKSLPRRSTAKAMSEPEESSSTSSLVDAIGEEDLDEPKLTVSEEELLRRDSNEEPQKSDSSSGSISVPSPSPPFSLTPISSPSDSSLPASFDDLKDSLPYSGTTSPPTKSFSSDSASGPSMYLPREDPPPKNPKVTKTFTITLKETNTFDIFYYPSRSARDTSPLGERYLTEIKDYDSKKVTASILKEERGTNTLNPILISFGVDIERGKRKSRGTQLAVSLLHDFYASEAEKEKSSRVAAPQLESKRIREELSGEEDYNTDNKFANVIVTPEFRMSCMAIERVIDSKLSFEKQLLYHGRFQLDPLAPKVKFEYLPTHLWTFKSEAIEKMPVTGLSFNSVNKNVIAVSYGTYMFCASRDEKGYVAVWNIKNTTTPERLYEFDSPAQDVCFSDEHPYLLAACFYYGYVVIIDVASPYKKILFNTKGRKFAGMEPLWQIKWFYCEEGYSFPVCCSESGKIFKFRKDATFKDYTMLYLGWKEGEVKGVKQFHSKPKVFSIPKRPAIYVITPHPTNQVIYLAGTEDGCVHICSVHYFYQHLDVFAAHCGAVYSIEFHPDVDKILLTAGQDFFIRVWMYNEAVPLLELKSQWAPIDRALWSPVHPLIIVSVIEDTVEVWDIRRKALEPASTTKIPSGCRALTIAFCEDGKNIVVGDMDGNVHVFALKNMPFPPIRKPDALADALKRVLLGQDDLLEMLTSIGGPFI